MTLSTLSEHAHEGYSSHFVCPFKSRRWLTFSTSKSYELKVKDDLSTFDLPLF